MQMNRAMRLFGAAVAGCLLAVGSASQAQVPTAPGATPALRVVGGLAGVNQFTRHEQPFWEQSLARISGGRFSAEVVPFDRAGIRGQEMLSMVRLGTVPFGTVLLSMASPKDAELAAPDLAGLNPDMASLRRSVAAWRPRLQTLLRERHGAELLAVYAYPAQVLFCRQPINGLSGLNGLRVRTSSAAQADFVEALGAQAVNTPFAQVVTNMRSGNMDCALTGTMSGNTIGLHEITSHLYAMPVSWGLSMFVAHGPSWRSLPAELRQILQDELPKLEAAIWQEAARETDDGIACNVGSAACTAGRKGSMSLLRTSPADDALRRDLLARVVLPRWIQRCGPECVTSWNRLMAPAVGIEARAH
jgi:TRAP-type C4-dicarboxylate transport system substrate-binding protein